MPAHNEERAIAKVVLGCKKYVDKVVVVDDGSTDATAEIAEALGAHVVRHPENGGYGAALRSCFETARELGADRMVIIDSDGQHDPAEIPKLTARILAGEADMVNGSRYITIKPQIHSTLFSNWYTKIKPQMNADERRYDYNNFINIFQPEPATRTQLCRPGEAAA